MSDMCKKGFLHAPPTRAIFLRLGCVTCAGGHARTLCAGLLRMQHVLRVTWRICLMCASCTQTILSMRVAHLACVRVCFGLELGLSRIYSSCPTCMAFGLFSSQIAPKALLLSLPLGSVEMKAHCVDLT